MSNRYPGGIIRKTPLALNPALGNAAEGIFTMEQYLQAVKAGTWPAYDPYFEYTTLLLHGNGTNGAQNNTFLDSSSNNFSITRNGNTTQGTFSPFSAPDGYWGNYFDGTDDYLSVADNAVLRPGAGAFTLEAWVYRNAAGAAHTIYAKGGASTGINFQITSGNVLRFTHTTTNIDSTGTVAANAWVHVAVVREGTGTNQTKLYINGVQDGQGTVSTDFTQTEEVRIGTNRGATDDFAGYISNVRFVKGSALYTAGFTPSTVPLTTTSQGASSSEVELLTCQSNRFVDNSTNAFAITRNGDVRVTPFSPFAPTAAYSASVNGGSGYWDGSGDSLSSSTSFEAATNTSTFTIEGWIYPTTFSQLINIIGGMVVSSGDQKSVAAEVNTSGQVALYWFDGAVKRCTGNSVMQLNAWNYFAIVVTSNAIAIYVNKTTGDTLSGTTTLTNRTQQTTLGVGAYYNNNTPAQYLTGYLSNLRYSTIARTISAVPTAPFTSDSNTRWLFNFTNAGIFDNTGKNNLETVGDAQIDTTTKKYGTGSLEFDGTGDYLKSTPNQDLDVGTGNWTVEAWIYPNNVSGEKNICGYNNTSASNFWDFGLDGSALRFRVRAGGVDDNTQGGTISATTWTHVAAVRESGTITLYINGSSVATNAVTMPTITTASSLGVGVNLYFGGFEYYWNGYIDDLRITKGIARYTANFTPQTSQWQDQ